MKKVLRTAPIPASPLTRIAPTPSGFIHAGNAVNFILTWLFARLNQGQVFLRIDDLDPQRCRPVYVENIFQSLEWLDLDWDGGPQTVDHFYRQHALPHRIDRYEAMHQELLQHHRFFACGCSRRQIQAAGNGLYPGFCRNQQHPYKPDETALRVHVLENWSFDYLNQAYKLSEMLGDFVIWRRDHLPAYQLASLLDDLDLGTNLLVRGADLLPSSAAQLYLADQLQLSDYLEVTHFHHGLITGPENEKLSKTQKAPPLDFSQSSAPLFQRAANFLNLPETEDIHTKEDLLTATQYLNLKSLPHAGFKTAKR